jgi:hypothetical protein
MMNDESEQHSSEFVLSFIVHHSAFIISLLCASAVKDFILSERCPDTKRGSRDD